MAYEVFISHSHQDKTMADAICATLESRQIRCWVAPRDLRPSDNWASGVIHGIEACRVMVLIFSAAANSSVHVMNEVERAVNRGLRIIPLRIENVVPAKALELFLSTPHWLDAISPPIEAHLQRLALVVESLLAPDLETPAEENTPNTGRGKERTPSTPDPSLATVLIVRWDAMSIITTAKIRIYIDGEQKATGSITKGFRGEFNVAPGHHDVAVIGPLLIRRTYQLEVGAGTYVVSLAYSWTWGNFKAGYDLKKLD